MQKQCTVDLWTAGYAGSRLTAPARSPMDKPWTTLCVAHRLPTGRRPGRRLPTSSTVLKPIVIKSGKVKTKTPAPALAYSSPVAVQTTGTTAHIGDESMPQRATIGLPFRLVRRVFAELEKDGIETEVVQVGGCPQAPQCSSQSL